MKLDNMSYEITGESIFYNINMYTVDNQEI